MSRFSWWIGVVLLLAGSGCEPAAHLAWSPDGTRAGYFVSAHGKDAPGSGYVIDGAGKVQAELGQEFGSFAWSGDSKTLYFGGSDPKNPAVDSASRKWMVNADDEAATGLPAGTAASKEEYPSMVLSRWRDGTVERLAPLGKRLVLFTQVSPDEKWISVVALAKDGDDGHAQLFAYSVASKKLYEISDHCGYGACFTDAGELAYVESDRDRSGVKTTGQIIEVQLDESVEHLKRVPLMDVMWAQTDDLQPTEDGLLFSSVARTFPGKISEKQASDDAIRCLFHFTRANASVACVAESTGSLFLTSPDGKRILYETMSAAGKPAELVVMNANGSDPHTLRKLNIYGPQILMWPTWHGNDGVTFVSSEFEELPTQEGQEPRLAFDVVNYKINAGGALETGKTLSEGWAVEMKPSIKKSDLVAPVGK